jgi:aryl-alcohol dehydrogenase-like predicted oxidoreductase
MTRYQCPEAQRRYKIARRLYRWRDQAYDRRAAERCRRLSEMADANKRRAQQIETAWLLARRIAA